MVGICGIGMAGVAWLLKARGLNVTGCDESPNALATWLEARGIPVKKGHSAEHLAERPDWVIRTAAAPLESPEISAAIEAGIPVFCRGEVLPRLLDGRLSVAVCGTHGKTTTTSFTTALLRAAGRAPSWCIGGENDELDGVSGAGVDEIVVEADESDGTLALYRPSVLVVTNVDFDHMEHFDGIAAFEDCFRAAMRQTDRLIVYCADDPRAAALAAEFSRGRAYGLSPWAAVRGCDVVREGDAMRFRVEAEGRDLGGMIIPVPGVHNVRNALAAVAVGLELGVSPDVIREALGRFRLPRRRFDRRVDTPDRLVISDYSHHPAEIRALVETAMGLGRPRLVGVFQPHRYTRTLALGADFPAAFDGLDELILTPVYAASEKPIRGGTTWDLYAHFRNRGEASETGGLKRPRVRAAVSLEQAWQCLRREQKPGDVLLVIGAGSVERIAQWAAAEAPTGVADAAEAAVHASKIRNARAGVSLAGLTTFGVGGAADWLAEPESVDELQALCRAASGRVPVQILGGGSNVVVSDLGVRGLTVRLSAAPFRRIAVEGETLVAGAGIPLARLLDWMEANGLRGLEYLEGIPGTLGGALRMNAGAWGQSVLDRVLWIHCLNPDGGLCRVRRESIQAVYRSCPSLEDRVAVEAAFVFERGDVQESRREREAIRERRGWMKGLRCAGSVFKNPEGDFAGRLVEAAGLKGRRVGGACVSERHANVITTGVGATGSDVRSLIEIVRAEVRVTMGVELETEVTFPGERV
jgi:UDP-N-acetylmuramate--L-alanine ligase/UDP-N-acetylenolpyruvoylglucosamine reductase